MQLIAKCVAFSLLIVVTLLVSCPLSGQAQEDIDDLLENARTAQSTGKYAEAADLYQRATALAPTTAELWANRGVMEYLADRTDAATSSLKHALQLNPNLFTPVLFLGKSYVETNKPAQALPYLSHAYSLRPKDPEVLLALGKANADLNRQQQAAIFYSSATHAAPDNPKAWLGLGAASLEVIATDGRVLASTATKSPWGRALFADELLAQGRPLEAADNYKAVMADAPPAQKAILIRNLLWMQSHQDMFNFPSNSLETLRQLAEQYKPDLSNSDPCYPAVSKSHAAPHSTADCAYFAEDYERSSAQASQVLRQSPQDAEALYWSIKSNERIATEALSRFEDISPNSAHVLVGDLYRDQRKPDNALIEYQKALAADPHDSAALLGAAAAYFTRNELDQAEAMDRTALADHPLEPQLNLLMAEILAARNHYDQIAPYLARCTDAPPEVQLRVHFLEGRVALEAGDKQEAIRQFELALPGDQDGSTHYQLLRLYRQVGNLAQAQKMEEEAKALIKKRNANAAIVVREATSTNP